MKLIQRSVLALALVGTLALTGCSGLLGGGSGGSDGGTGGTGGNGQSGASDDKPSATAEPSTDDSTGLEGYEGKPTTFPGDVPIIDGDIPFGVDLGTGWTVIIKADDLVAAYKDAESRLTGAGFTSQLSSTTDDGSFGSFDNDKYTIQVTAADNSDYGPSVTYVVILKG